MSRSERKSIASKKGVRMKSVSIVFLVHAGMRSLSAAADNSRYRLPQHRIRATKRMIQYSPDHPWRHLNSIDTEDAIENGGASAGPLPEAEAEDFDENEDGEFSWGFRHLETAPNVEILTKSKIKVWSTTSGRSLYENHADSAEDGPNADVDSEAYYEESRTSAPANTHENIRIRASMVSHESSGTSYLSENERFTLLKEMIHPALDTWSQALLVAPIHGKLTIDVEQLYDGVSCGPGLESGLPSVVVPQDHIEDGISETDLIVYVSVGFHKDLINEMLEADFDYENGLWDRRLSRDTPDDIATEEDEEIIVTRARSPPLCSGNYLASSTYCSTDQFDRNIAGMLHLCIGKDFFTDENLKLNQITIMHELGHILGFNSQSLAHFRDRETGEPITKRDSNGDVIDQKVECTGVAEGRGGAYIPLPSREILQFQEVRGGQRVAHIVTPNVRQIARNHFDCQELSGAELESSVYHLDQNQTNFLDVCVGDHWERRLFKSDIMNPLVDSVLSATHISPLTLGYFMDSGWYDVDVSRASEPDIWGRAAGCDFVKKQCISETGQVSRKNSQFFCSSTVEGCAADMTGKASCSMVAYDKPLAEEFQYFANPHLGGEDIDLDFCPSFMGGSHDFCENGESTMFRMEESGKISRCVSGKHGQNSNAALCVPIACAIEQRSVSVRVDRLWKECQYEGQVIESWFDSGNYDPIRTCPSFYCPRDCLDHGFTGVCNYSTKNCTCPLDLDPFSNSCNITNKFDFPIDISSASLYVLDSAELVSASKNIFDHTARMFILMTPGEVIGFIATSLVVMGLCFILGSYFYRCIQQPSCNISRFCDKEWRVDSIWYGSTRLADTIETVNRRDKDKMVASVLHNLRVESTLPTSHFDAENGSNDEEERTFWRSEIPPLPGVGRIVSVVGATYVNDSIVPTDIDETRTIDGTANDSRTSGENDMNSSHGTEGLELNQTSNMNTSRLRVANEPVPISQTRRRVLFPRRSPSIQ